jgi:hypothetical protein
MREVLFEFHLGTTTWAYVSALMTIGIYFKFHRLWSVRNLDLIGLILFSPGLLMIYHGLMKSQPGLVHGGYAWVFGIGGFFVIRLLLDPVMVRRPLLEPNLSAGGLTFTGAALLVFLCANVITDPAQRLERVLDGEASAVLESPGYRPLLRFTAAVDQTLAETERTDVGAYRQALFEVAAARTAAIVAHLTIVIGIVLIGYRHFDNIHTGMAAATLYLLTFYTSQLTGRVDHVLPAALIVWSVEMYRRPVFSGIMLGIAGALIFYPLLLLPLWFGFYWRRGLWRFLIGSASGLGVMVLALLVAGDVGQGQLRQMFGLMGFSQEHMTGFWAFHAPVFRIPVAAGLVALSASFALWPAQKNLGTLLSCSAAVMVAAQFWQVPQGGLYMAWYLPLLVLTIFRPNLEDRMAVTAVV